MPLTSPVLAWEFLTTSASWETLIHNLTINQTAWLRRSRTHLQCGRPGFTPWVGNIPLEKGKATHSSILAWRIPWTGVTKSWAQLRDFHFWPRPQGRQRTVSGERDLGSGQLAGSVALVAPLPSRDPVSRLSHTHPAPQPLSAPPKSHPLEAPGSGH